MSDAAHAFTLTQGFGAVNKEKWVKTHPSLQDLVFWLAKSPEADNKDGLCFVPGEFIGSRKAMCVTNVQLLVYDIDGQQTIEEVIDLLNARKVFSLIYTTFNHMSPVMTIDTGHYDKWAQRTKNNKTATVELLQKYLNDPQGGAKPHIKLTGPFDGKHHVVHTRDATNYVYKVGQQPYAKFRVVLPLTAPIIIEKLSHVLQDAIHKYKEIYVGTGQHLGLKFDYACSDPSRLYYAPSHPAGTDFWEFHALNTQTENIIDWSAMPKAVLAQEATKTRPDGTSTRKTLTDFGVHDKNNQWIDLFHWSRNNAQFQMEELLRDKLPSGMIRDDRSSGTGFAIECPFEHEHTTPGGVGTFVTNDNMRGEEHWTISCSHDSCKRAGRGKIDFLKALIGDGYLTAEDLGLKKQDIVKFSVDPALGVDPSTLPAFDPAEFDTHKQLEKRVQDRAELLEEARTKIENASLVKDLQDGIDIIAQNQLEVTADQIINMLASSQVPVKVLRDHCSALAPTIKMTPKEVAAAVSGIRQKRMPVAIEIQRLVNDSYAGYTLHQRMFDLSQYYGIPRTEINKDYNTKKRDNALNNRTDATLLARCEDLNRNWAIVRQGSAVLYVDKEQTRREGGFHALSPAAFREEHSSSIVTILPTSQRGSMREEEVAPYWIKHYPNKEQYYGVTFEPDPDKIDPVKPRFNIWNGFTTTPLPGDTTIIDEHLRHIWCGGDDLAYQWLMTFIADIVQNPGVKPGAAVALLSAQGAGKSSVLNLGLGKILYPYYVATPRRDDIIGRFNSATSMKLCCLAEEAIFAGDKANMEKLKFAITEDKSPLEYKGRETVMVPNYCRYFFTANASHAVAIDPDDRRFFVLNVSEERRQDAAYHARIRHFFKEENGAQKWMHALLTWRPEDYGLTWSDLFKPRMTQAKLEQIAMSTDTTHEFFTELLRWGRLVSLPSSVELPVKINWGLDEEIKVSSELFRQLFDTYGSHFAGSRMLFERGKFHVLFKKYFGAAVRDYRTRKVEGKGHYVESIKLPPRRHLLEAALKKGLVSNDMVADAIANPQSHLPLYDTD